MKRRRILIVLELLVTAVTCMLGISQAISASGALLNVSIARDNCDAQCGKVKIPFPFGIGSHCSVDKWFEIFCNKSTTPHRPFLNHTGWEVLDIADFYTEAAVLMVSDTSYYYRGQNKQLQIKNPISFFNCANKLETQKTLNLTGMPFSFTSGNIFVGVSCGIPAKINSSSGNRYYQTGCTSICSSNDNRTTSNHILCDGIDCCETSISDIQVDTFEILFDNNSTITAAEQNQYESEKECKFAFMADGDYWSNYKNHSMNITRIRDMGYVPLNLSWYLNYTDFDLFKTDMSDGKVPFHSCYHEEYDYSSTNEQYRHPTLECYCRGLRGNPYLIEGCSQDVNECAELPEIPDRCGGGATCVNTYGGYHCSYKRKFILIGVGSSVGALFLLFGIWGLYKFIKRRKEIKRKQKFFKRNGGLLLQQQISSNESTVEKTKLFNSNELQKATANFSIDRILGQGGQGTVYKGMLEDGKIVAIKKSKVVDEAQLSEFINEVVILSQINHRNVVQLLGCCLETEVPLLVYEFIPNGTLSQYIHEQNEEFPFTWKMRLQVATEVAGALSYLHSAASFPIYHRDIKSTNILLDEKYRAKVADFGTSRTISIEQTHLTTIVYGTFDYLDPEYFQSSQFTEKSDVYSFGVVLVELLTGQKAISATRSAEGRNLATYFVMRMEADDVFEIIDSQVLEDAPKEEIRQMANLAQRCLNLTGRNRPTMKEVAMVLEGIQKPERAAFTVQQNHEEVEYVRTEFIEPWDVASTSTGSALDRAASTGASLLQELPLLSFGSH
ncbi:hypothetical protein TIFTF001_039002 [Ficus carica]|uniref:Protein kinase domain-containing protein n=1 Tax=Ficus carica TaxID=3494 RepID=A0AA88E8C6_FICCA|nr:hypothetical protein TIFTF001_039002 [Ficus carica]